MRKSELDKEEIMASHNPLEYLQSARRMELKSKSAFCGGFYDELGQVYVAGSGQIPDAHFNRISILDADAVGGQLLRDAVKLIGAESPIFIDALHPVSDALRQFLKEHGFQSTGELRASMMLHGRQPENAPVAGLTIREVRPEMLDTFLELFLRNFDTPEEMIPLAKSLFHDLVLQHARAESVRMYLGVFNEEPACTEYLFHEGEEGGVNMVSTKASFRGKGLASAMLRRLMDDAQGLGVRLLSLETRASSAPERLYQALGFETIAVLEIFANLDGLKYGL
jgi:ribosomal protein S18 acetylase RimI-like enzyme